MRTHIIARKTHKWLGLFIGLQVVIWSLSGLYMTVVHIDTIHGDHLVRSTHQRFAAADSLVDPVALASANGANAVRLAWLRDQPLFVTTSEAGETAFDASTGKLVAGPNEAAIRELARSYYTGREPILAARLVTDIPGEIRGRSLRGGRSSSTIGTNRRSTCRL